MSSPSVSPHEAFCHAVAMVRGQSAFSIVIGRAQTTISDWLKLQKPLPAEHVIAAEGATGVSRHLLRPDIYPLEHGALLPSLPPLPDAAANVACDRRSVSHQSAAA